MTKIVIVGEIYYGDRYPDQGLPPGQGGQPSHPIHYPGSPSQPIYHPGHPDHGHIPYPDQGLPGQGGGSGGSGGHPSHPIHIPGVPDQGLPQPEPIPPEGVTPPTIPPGHEDDLVIAVRQPNSDEWTYSAYDVAPSQGQPQPTPHAPPQPPQPPQRRR